ncbi:MAG: aminopeptidase P family protein [Thaumarchaeota archaeon]|nr:aminopeptidase P family protein [Nitrososphaerota archaeon]
MSNFTKERIQKIARIAESEGKKFDFVLLKNGTEPHLDLSFFYITGLEAGLFEGCALAAYPDGETRVYTSKLEEQSALKGSRRFDAITFKDRDNLAGLLKKDLSGHGNLKIGINSNELTHKSFEDFRNIFPKAEFVDISSAMVRARMVKDEHEIATIKESARIASKAFPKLLDNLKDGMTEYEAATVLNSTMQHLGAQGSSFDTIVAFGENSAEPHYSPGSFRLKNGNFALFDYGAKYRRYCSDITRTVVYGKASKQQKEIYNIVLEANQLGIDASKVGVKAGGIHRKVSKFIDNTKYKGMFIHSTGHTIGLAVHDGAVIHPAFDGAIEENMVFTIEPGIYLPGFGGVRIEDDIVVRKNKAEVLTTAPKELIEV